MPAAATYLAKMTIGAGFPQYAALMSPRPNLHDALLAGGLFVWGIAEVATGAVHGPAAVGAICALVAAVPLAWRRMAPTAVGLVCAGVIAVRAAWGLPLDGMALLVTALVAAYSVGRHRAPTQGALTVAAMVVLSWIGLFGLPQRGPYDYVFGLLWLGAPAVAGGTLRTQVRRAELAADRAVRAELLRDEHTRQAMQAERGRIARELHDTVAHAVSVMVLHAGAVRSRLPEELPSEKDALAQAEESGRRAIAELRRLLGVLRSDTGLQDTEPQPTLAQVARLADAARHDGLLVDFRVDGQARPLEPGLEVTAYRIIQEALTNVRKHARARAVSILVAYDGDGLRVRVTDDGVGSRSGNGTSGFGLLGMKERVAVYGGSLRLGAAPSGGFEVDAALPLRP